MIPITKTTLVCSYLRLVKQSIAIFLVLAISFQVCSKLVVVSWFSINQEVLTELFCINKQKIETHCNGKCYLNKKLKETDQETQQGSTTPVKHKSSTEEVWFCELELCFIVPALAGKSTVPVSANHYSFQTPTSIFQPPRA